MAIHQTDWIKDTAWSEQHLTRSGWMRGTVRNEKGRFEREVEPPADRLLTVRMLSRVPSDPKAKMAEWTEIRWIARDADQLEKAQERWGVLPFAAPTLSSQSAAQHAGLRYLPEMQMPREKRLSNRWPWS